MNENQLNDKESHKNNEGESKLNTELNACIIEREAWKEKFLRVQADLDNFSKRIDKERYQWKNTAQSMVLFDMLTIVDDFNRAFETQNIASLSADMQKWLEGFELIRRGFYKLLDK